LAVDAEKTAGVFSPFTLGIFAASAAVAGLGLGLRTLAGKLAEFALKPVSLEPDPELASSQPRMASNRLRSGMGFHRIAEGLDLMLWTAPPPGT
jgi:hypothetical protein